MWSFLISINYALVFSVIGNFPGGAHLQRKNRKTNITTNKPNQPRARLSKMIVQSMYLAKGCLDDHVFSMEEGKPQIFVSDVQASDVSLKQ